MNSPRYCPPRRELITDSVPVVESPSVKADDALLGKRMMRIREKNIMKEALKELRSDK